MNGPKYYAKINQFKSRAGLDICLLSSLIVGDYSVHSANIGVTNTKEAQGKETTLATIISRFLRIDWGAAFRLYAKNSKLNIFYAAEYGGDSTLRLNPAKIVRYNTKNFSKGYISNYKTVTGLFKDVRQAARAFEDRLYAETKNGDPAKILEDCIFEALRGIPSELISPKIRKQLVEENFEHKTFPGFAKVCTGGDPENNRAFSRELAKVMMSRVRLAKRTGLDKPQDHTKHLESEVHALKLEREEFKLKLELAEINCKLAAQAQAASQEQAASQLQKAHREKTELEAELKTTRTQLTQGEQQLEQAHQEKTELEAKLKTTRTQLDEPEQKLQAEAKQVALKSTQIGHFIEQETKAESALKAMKTIAAQQAVTAHTIIGMPLAGASTGLAIALPLHLFAAHHATIHLGAKITISAMAAGCWLIGIGFAIGLLALLVYTIYSQSQQKKSLATRAHRFYELKQSDDVAEVKDATITSHPALG